MTTFGIDSRVWSIVGQHIASPEYVALAASVCPEALGEKTKWKPYASLRATENSPIAQMCGTQPLQIRNALVEWAMDSIGPVQTLRDLLSWDHKLGVWCALAVAEPALRFIPATETRPRKAIETARRWVMGRATINQLRKASDAADAAALEFDRIEPDQRAALAASIAAYWATGASTRGYATNVVPGAASAYAYDIYNDSRSPEWNEAQDAEIERLRGVIAQAIISYPTGEMVNASRGVMNRSALVAGLVGVAIGAGAVRLTRRQ